MDNNFNNGYNDDNNGDLEKNSFELVPVQYDEIPPKKAKTPFYKKTAVVGIVLCIIASSAMGFLGGMFSNNIMNKENSGGNSSSSLKLETVNSNDNQTTNLNNQTIVSVSKAVENSVVEITTETVTTGNFMQQYISEGAGSGVILSSDGYIVTNNHVISKANKITVTLKNGESHQAKLVGTDSDLDVALLKIDVKNLVPVTLGDSSKLQVGELAVAVGNPLGQLGGTVTTGIISALNRDITIGGETMNLLQTNAAINPGNSGGGLFNSQGQLIGLVVAKSSGSDVEGLGFAIPINDVKKVVEEISKHGYVRGKVDLQMSLIDIDSTQLAMMYRVPRTGVYVSKVTSGSNAEKAGFKSGDCIISLDSNTIRSSSDIEKILDKKSVGDTVSVIIERDNKSVTLNWTLAEYVPQTNTSNSLSGIDQLISNLKY